MPRATQYLQPGFTYHLTHRCHNKEFHLRYARYRNAYREWLRQGVARHAVSLYGFCLTHNHTHVIARADDVESISALMHLASGATAKQYNLRRERMGSMWEHPFHCTRIQDGRHLFNCLCYVDLNMVRAGVVRHPRDWKWCGYHELMGLRRRYRLLDLDRLVGSLELQDVDAFRAKYEEALAERIRKNHLRREPVWTESIAVGAKGFVENAMRDCTHRQKFEIAEVEHGDAGVWSVREARIPYG
jgi:putative transposase